MTTETADWRRLAQYVASRRRELGLTQQDVKAAGGPSTATMRLIEGAHQTSYRPLVLGQLERVLEWGPGSIEAILAGGEPSERGRTVTARTAHDTITFTDHATASVTSAREVRQQKIALARQILREALSEEAPAPVEDVDEFRLEERIARLRRLMAQRRDTASAAELDLMLKMYEEGEETG